MNHESKAEDFLFLVLQSVSRANTVNISAPSLSETHKGNNMDWEQTAEGKCEDLRNGINRSFIMWRPKKQDQQEF
jgi:hypothetical protein